MATTRPYKVTDKETGTVRLVLASSQSQTRNYVAGQRYSVDTANANDVIDLMSAGVKPETATEESEGA